MGQENIILYYLAALGLGALHAFEPGHGKTLIATYMIGTRGRAIDGVILGITTTFTHTFSVILLGIIAKVLSTTYSEDQLHGWLGLLSAALIMVVGIWMLRQRLTGKGGHGHFHLFGGHHHDHDHDANHGHGGHAHSHNHAQHNHDGQTTGPKQRVRYNTWNLLLLGISGGLIPCPAAIATLLMAIAAGRIAHGLTLALSFSLGLGLVMITIGVLLSHAGKLTNKIDSNPKITRYMGIASAVIITVLGSATMFHSVQTLWFS